MKEPRLVLMELVNHELRVTPGADRKRRDELQEALTYLNALCLVKPRPCPGRHGCPDQAYDAEDNRTYTGCM